MSGPSPAVRATVLTRAGYRCELCQTLVSREFSVHHRRPRRMGGTRRADANAPHNLLLLCGSGTTGCHGWVESHRTSGYDDGIILYDRDDPADYPYRDRLGQWWILTPSGTKHPTDPPTGVGCTDNQSKGNHK